MNSAVSLSLATDPLSAAIQERDSAVLDMVRHALKTRQVMLAYQPVVLAQNPTQPSFFESFLRVTDNSRRVIPAKSFIDTIERREEGRLMDCLAIEMGLEALSAHPNVRISVNMSARSIDYPAWTLALQRGLAKDPSVADRLIIEITEASAMEMPDRVIEFMHKLQKLGICFALDDFGAGYTAFRYLREFYFDIVKIDATFIKNVHEDANNQVLVEALRMISEQFEMFTVAEGVEKPEEAEFLKNANIDYLQGYLFAAPSLSLSSFLK